MIPKFTIFYDDNTIVEGGGEDDEVVELTFRMSKKWLESPNDGIQVVIVENPYNCRYVWRGTDHYFMLPQDFEIHAADDIGSYLRKHLQGMLKFGLCIGTEQWEEVWRRVRKYDEEVGRIPRNCGRRRSTPDTGVDTDQYYE